MDNREIASLVAGIPHMSRDQADRMRSLIDEYALRSVLELGFNHGVSTCYLAAAVEPHEGSVTTIDLDRARDLEPDVFTLLERAGLTDRVEVIFEPTSYNWAMMRMLEAQPPPRFDLVYVDGAHTWLTDGLAFFLADRLLEPGGWIVFDDLDWTQASSPSRRTRASDRPLAEQETPQVRKIYELLVKPHPDYVEFREEAGWAFARKRRDSASEAVEIKRELVVRRIGLGASIRDLVERLHRRRRG